MTGRLSEWVDWAFVLLMGTLVLYGMHGSYTSLAFLGAGILGLLLGSALAVLAKRLGQPVIVLATAVAVVFFVGGFAVIVLLGGSAASPFSHPLGQLADASIHGWKDLLTTLAPVADGPLLVLPYLVGLVGGVVAQGLALNVRWAPAPVVAMLALLALVIALGVKHPQHVALTAAGVGALSLVWMSLRANRGRTRSQGRRFFRRAVGALMAAGVAAVAVVAGPALPGVGDDRAVLRDVVIPPFDVGQYPSPLVTFRRYTAGFKELRPTDALYNQPIFRISGVPEGTRVRIASLDSYDGNVWAAGNAAGTATDVSGDNTFQKVGQVIDNPATGTPVSAEVTILSDALGVWLPEVGSLTGITFKNPDEQVGSDEFRYNLISSTGVYPAGLSDGSSYSFQAVIPNDVLESDTILATGALPGVQGMNQFQETATSWAGHPDSSLDGVRAIAAYLKDHGHYSDGEKGFEYYAAGHSLHRLTYFLSTSGQLAGNDEQYAALMALMSNELGVPARVVVGAVVPPGDGTVRGKDVHAWVEVQSATGEWKTLAQTEFMSQKKPEQQTTQIEKTVKASAIPPPAPVHPPATAGEQPDSKLKHRASSASDKGIHLPAFVWFILKFVVAPILLILLLALAVVAAKAWRRKRRRSRGPAHHRLGLAWHEIVDCARDFGKEIPRKATRREQAAALAYSGIRETANRADSAMFQEDPPTDDVVNDFWAHVDDMRKQIAKEHSRWQRIRAAVSVGTLWRREATG